jgi:hypothetical protein
MQTGPALLFRIREPGLCPEVDLSTGPGKKHDEAPMSDQEQSQLYCLVIE